MTDIDSIIRQFDASHPDGRADKIRKAYEKALALMGPRTPETGEIELKLLETSAILADLNMDEITISAVLLSPFAKTKADTKEIAALFGDEVAVMSESVHRLNLVRYSSGTRADAESFRRLVLSMAHDVRVVMIVLADRLRMMRVMTGQNPVEESATAFETLEIYAPLANRLGIYKLKKELEDLGLKHTEPKTYADIESKLGKGRDESESYIKEVKEILNGILSEHHIKGHVSGRTKHIFSIHKKMIEQNIPFERVYDRIAFRIIVDELRDCYGVLGAVHAKWTPLSGRFKDYIALPKPNLYQSLHTTVMGPRKQPMEVQIRTVEMHRIAEEGVAAHWRYKEKRTADQQDRVVQWLRGLVESTDDTVDARIFADEVKSGLYPDTVYVFSPAGDVIELPKGSTPVDFAFNVHSQVGMTCVGSKVNERMVPLDHILKNGDRVEIITSKHQTPSSDWLEFVKSSKARNRIKQWIRTEQRKRAIQLGQEMCDREFRKVGRSFTKALREGLLDGVYERLGFNKPDEVLEAVGFGKLNTRSVLEKIYPEYEQKEIKEPEEPRRARKKTGKSKGIVIKGVGDAMVRFAKCCNPLPMEPIAGFITRGQGLTVHTLDCPNMVRSDPERRVEVEWGMGEDTEHRVRIRVVCADKKGMLANITQTLASNDVNVNHAEVKTFVVGRAECTFDITVANIGELTKILRSIQTLKDVYGVHRLKS